MYLSDKAPSPDQLAFQALDDATRADLVMRVHHARSAVNAHPSKNKHYEGVVDAVAHATEGFQQAGMQATATELEYLNGRLHLIAESPKNGHRTPVQMRLRGLIDKAFRDTLSWHDTALHAPLKGLSGHERYMEKQQHFYNTDRDVPQAYKRFMGMTSDKGVRLKNFTDRDLDMLVRRTQDLLADIGARMPHELASWYLAAHSHTQKPESWNTLYAANQFNSLPGQLVAATLNYHPEAGIYIEQDRAAIAEKIRHLVQPERGR